jgi:alkylated DNA nucleotide flippase Atl1
VATRWSWNVNSYTARGGEDSSLQKKRKSWEEKLNEAKDLPKVVQLKGKAKHRWNAETLAIASPREIFSLIQKVPAGKVATIADLQAAVAKEHAAEMGCPLTTGIFTWIAAKASEELEAKRAGSGAPYWRILKSDGSLNPKFPGGIERQAKRLAKEGVASEKHGVKTRVVGLDEIRYHF